MIWGHMMDINTLLQNIFQYTHTERKKILSEYVQATMANDSEVPKDSTQFFDFLSLYCNEFDDVSALRPLIRKCKYDDITIQKHNVLNKIMKERRVSWDPNLTQVREIESCKKRNTSKIEYNNTRVYVLDIQKICECNKEVVRRILHDEELVKALSDTTMY